MTWFLPNYVYSPLHSVSSCMTIKKPSFVNIQNMFPVYVCAAAVYLFMTFDYDYLCESRQFYAKNSMQPDGLTGMFPFSTDEHSS